MKKKKNFLLAQVKPTNRNLEFMEFCLAGEKENMRRLYYFIF